jgi:hypothetical protein
VPRTLQGAHLCRLATLLGVLACLVLTQVALAPRAHAAQTAAVQTHLLWGSADTAEMDRQLDWAKSAGAGLVRVDVGWGSIERDGKGRYEPWYLSKVDAVLERAEARGLKVLFTFWQTPCWASKAPESLKQGCTGQRWNRNVEVYPPANPADYGDALAYMIRRYGNRVAAWEIWNEPNLDYFFTTTQPVAEYTELVKAGYRAAKAADPSATIIAGSLADADFGFTEEAYRLGIKGHFDAWSVHPYSADRSPLDPFEDQYIRYTFSRGVPAVRDVMLRQGDDKPIWLTEFGWSTCTVRTGPAYERCVSESTQAEYLMQAYRHMRSWSYVPVGVWYNLRDRTADTGDRVSNYGLVRHDGSEKPAFAAFRTVAAELGSGSAPPPSGSTDTGTGTGTSGGGDSGTRTGGVRLKVKRKRGRVVVYGSAPAGSTVRLHGFRYNRARSRWSHRPALRRTLRARATGRFKRRLSERSLRRGRWRFTARVAGTTETAAATARLR